MSALNLASFTVQIFRPEGEPARDIGGRRIKGHYVLGEQDKRVLANLPAMMEVLEEDLTSLLPEGYRAIAKEWSE